MDEFGFRFSAGGLETDVGAASLERFEVGAGGNFAIELLAGEPDFEVEGLGGGEAGVGGAEQDAAVGKLESFEDLLSVARQLLVLCVGLLGPGELDQFDLLKLVLANDAARVLACGSGFGAEAGRVGRKADRKPGFVEDFVAIEVGDGNLGGGDEPVVVVLNSPRATASRSASEQRKRSSANLGSWPVPKRLLELTMKGGRTSV